MHIPAMIERRVRLLAVENLDLRILYLLKLISEEEFKNLIYERWKLLALFQAENAILQGLRSKLFEYFLTNKTVKETNIGIIYKETNKFFEEAAKQTSNSQIEITLKEGWKEKRVFWLYGKNKNIKRILYEEEWYYFV